MIYQHLEATESARAKEVLADWAQFQGQVLEGDAAASGRHETRGGGRQRGGQASGGSGAARGGGNHDGGEPLMAGTASDAAAPAAA